MSTVTTSLNILTSSYTAVGALNKEATTTDDQTTNSDSILTNNSATSTVRLSNAASKISQNISSYAPYFPTRPGMSADALINGVSNPGSVSSSQGKSFADVATDARKSLDANYGLMKDSGTPYNSSSFADNNSLFGNLDRRSLYAIASNQGGLFTKQEQASATYLMNQQQSLATGFYTGPPDQQKNFVDPFGTDVVSRAKAGLSFLENVSTEEKASPYWLKQHQQLTSALQLATSPQNASADPKTSSQPHMNLAQLMAQWSASSSESDPFGAKASSAVAPGGTASSVTNPATHTGDTSGPPVVKPDAS
ncbi:hypothetical protein [Pseudomonas sp. NA-150]|uniref:hypothetical protein n=1 Tax=Pseudomonas sp. NA-150 TaxID=3367525 RepID=UPI0037C8172F